MLLSLFDRIPTEGDKVSVAEVRDGEPVEGGASAQFTVVDMDNHRIDKIEVRAIPAQDPLL